MKVTKTDLKTIPVPEKTTTYTPIPHAKIIKLIKKAVKKYDLVIMDEKYALTSNKAVALGKITFVGEYVDVNPQLAWLNSYNKTRAFKIAVGAEVFICSNGMVIGDLKMNRKHTGDAMTQVAEMIDTVIQGIIKFSKSIHKDVQSMKYNKMNEEDAAKILGELFLSNVLTSAELNKIKKELHNSNNFNQLDNAMFSLWDMYNHITEVTKNCHPTKYIEKHKAINIYLENYSY